MPMQLTGHVLIVDDERHIRHYLSLIVRGLGPATVHTTTGGEAAIALFHSLQPKPELVILDINMPGIDGIETLRRLRDQGATCAIVLLTSLVTRETIEAALAAGGTAFIRKDTPKEEIAALLGDILEAHAGETEDSEPTNLTTSIPVPRVETAPGSRRDLSWDGPWHDWGM